ncbi:MAG: beta-N-acetylhexosaminidase [Proteobacteria bacterium]|nr:beta-N-acetylhexosaminidase [Pseudomonadota bacterium]
MKPAILGISGPALTPDEAALFRRLPPAGVILFGRNIVDPPQLAKLMATLRAVLSPDAVLMVDQEGGRVARLRPPHWAAHPAAGVIGALYDRSPAAGLRAAWLHGAAIGAECRAAGLDMVAAPVLDLAVPGQDRIVGDRSFGADPAAVAALGLAMAEGLEAGGVIPVAKHVPGHGRARVDSHIGLPRVAAEGPQWSADIAPFRQTAGRIPCMMTAHILYEGLDDDRPGTLSPIIVQTVIREAIGFHGLLLSDDLAMNALAGTPLLRAEAALAAGCDIALYCPGDAAGNAAILDALADDVGLAQRLRGLRPEHVPAPDLVAWLAERAALLETGR